eukprot:c16458_g1_i1.p1 GENE.c16458_g1_i1~~c16458_g1_i1.p1  ORF type:complete len:1047 (+),score=249.20 c16458_g1_i1:359-3499(+)
MKAKKHVEAFVRNSAAHHNEEAESTPPTTQQPAPVYATYAVAKEFLASLPPEFYQDGSYDASMFLLENLTEQDNCFADATINESVRAYERGLDLINAQISEAVIKNSDAFVSAMTQIQTLETDLLQTCLLCRRGRTSLQSAQKDLTSGGLQILSDNARKRKYQDLFELLNTVDKLRDTESTMAAALDRGNSLRAARCNVRLFNMPRQQNIKCTQAIWDRARDHFSTLHGLINEQTVAVLHQFDAALWERLVRCYMFLKLPDEMMACLRQTLRQTTFRFAAKTLHATLPSSADSQNFADGQVWLRALGRKVTEQSLSPSLTAVLTGVVRVMGVYAECVRTTVSMANRARDNDNSKLEYDTDSSKSESESESPPSSPVQRRRDDEGSSARVKGEWGSRSRRLWHNEEEREAINALRPGPLTGMVGLRTAVWEWAQTAVITLLEEAKLPAFKVEVYLEFVNSVNDFVRFGKLFAADDLDLVPCQLETTVAARIKSMFLAWHKDNIDSLRTVIKNEKWTRFTLSTNFSFNDLPEMLEEKPRGATLGHKWLPDVIENIKHCSTPEEALCAISAAFEENGSPWDPSGVNGLVQQAGFTLRSIVEEAELRGRRSLLNYAGEDDDGTNPFDEPVVPPQPTTASVNRPVVTGVAASVAVNAAKLLGRYIQIMEAVPILSESCFECFKEISVVFVNAVFTVFAGEALSAPSTPEPIPPTSDAKRVTGIMKNTVKGMTTGVKGVTGAMMSGMHIHKGSKSNPTSASLAVSSTHAASVWSGSHALSLKVPKGVVLDDEFTPHASLASSGAMFGLIEASVGASSLDFLHDAISHLTSRIEKVLPGRLKGVSLTLEEAIAQRASAVGALVYDTLTVRIVNMAPHCASIKQVSWSDVNETNVTRNNKYVEDILQDLATLKQRTDVASLAPTCQEKVWNHVMMFVTECLVDTYSGIKKLNTGGLALMSLDLQMLRNGSRKVLPPTCVVNWAYVDNYIKAHYLAEPDVKDWIQKHPEYRLKHIHSLIYKLVPKKKSRSELLAAAKELHKETAGDLDATLETDT